MAGSTARAHVTVMGSGEFGDTHPHPYLEPLLFPRRRDFASNGRCARRRQKVRCDMATTPDRALADVRFLTVAEVAAVMRVSKMTVYRLVHNGELPAVRVGRSFRVPEQAVHDYLRDSYIETA